MGKIICDICGTTYPDTADSCPICGCTRETAAGLLGDDLLLEQTVEEEPKTKGGRFSANKKKKEIFDFDEADAPAQEPPEEPNPYEEEEDYTEEPRHNTGAVVVLTILIVALLGAAAFLFVRYYLPNLMGEPVSVEDEPTAASTEAPTTTSGIPCQSLALTSGTASGTAELTQEGQYFLLHVLAMPEDTTDPIVFASGDETIATVTEDGRITAVGEGETVIYITCGDQQLTCPVVCRFTEPTEATTAPTEATAADATGDGAEATEATVAATVSPDVVLKLKRTDIRLGVYYQYTLQLDCELAQDAVEWSSEHPHIATVDENGVVTAVKEGTTAIKARYGDQEVSCLVRCFVP